MLLVLDLYVLQPASSCLAACTASMCFPVATSFFSGGVQMECIRRGMLECVWGNQDPGTDALVGNVVFFTHLPLSLHYLHIFCNNPHKGVLENRVSLLSVGVSLEVGCRATASIFLFLQLLL